MGKILLDPNWCAALSYFHPTQSVLRAISLLLLPFHPTALTRPTASLQPLLNAFLSYHFQRTATTFSNGSP